MSQPQLPSAILFQKGDSLNLEFCVTQSLHKDTKMIRLTFRRAYLNSSTIAEYALLHLPIILAKKVVRPPLEMLRWTFHALD